MSNDDHKLKPVPKIGVASADSNASPIAVSQARITAATSTDDLAGKLAFLEARLTLLERSFAKRLPATVAHGEPLPQGHTIKIACDEPGLFISRSYPSELDASKQSFCWIGSDGPLQFIFPVVTKQAMACAVKLIPHSKVNLQGMRLFANDQPIPHTIKHSDGSVTINFELPPSGPFQISLIIANLSSVRPRDLGENTDSRLLAARFYGAELTVR